MERQVIRTEEERTPLPVSTEQLSESTTVGCPRRRHDILDIIDGIRGYSEA